MAGTEPSTLFEPGEQVDNFKVVRSIGRGGMGEVFLARDTQLGRKVALKVVRPERFGSEQAVERFLFEARTTARFNHPHIVTIYAVGEHGGKPYVALEYLQGQSLRQRMRTERLGVREAMRLALAVAEALTEAHDHGVLHRDLKPDNVLIPEDGRPRVVDFGLAKVVDSAPRATAADDTIDPASPPPAEFESDHKGPRGTPAYMAPEQWLEEEITGATDIWALGTMLYELLARCRPYEPFETSYAELCMRVIHPTPVPPMELDREVPDGLLQLITDCLHKSPTSRPTAAEVRMELRQLLSPGRLRVSDEDAPFRGLEAFAERHAGLFFGRDTEIGAALERLRQVTTLPVVGPSGAGKSSFIRAGLIPRLREQGSWTVLSLRPGSDPFRALVAQLTAGSSGTLSRGTPTRDSLGQTDPDLAVLSGLPTASLPHSPLMDRPRVNESESLDTPPSAAGADVRLATSLRNNPTALNLMLQQLAEQRRCRVLLFVDQLEELYTLVDDEALRRAFMRAICTAADDPLAPVRVVFTLRDDFLGRLAEGDEAREALSRVTVLRSPGPEALREILVRPLEAVGYQFDDETLVEEMIAEVHGEPAGLPLLQFAARMMWDRRQKKGRQLSRKSYEAVGGVGGALAEHANGVLAGMTPSQAALARDICLRLVTAEGTRRLVTTSRVLEGLGDEARDVLSRLTMSRLVTVRKSADDENAEAQVELSHESLVHNWKRLARWIEQSSEELTFLGEVEQVAELWESRGCPPDEVWRGEALSDALRSLEQLRRAQIPALVRRFLDASQERELRSLRFRRLQRWAGLVALILLAVISWIVAISLANKEREAVHQRLAAEEQGAQALLEAAQAASLRGHPLEARAKLRGSLEMRDSTASRSLWWQLSGGPQMWVKQLSADVYDVAYSPDGRLLAAASQDRTIYLLDARTRATVRVLRGHEDQVFSLDYSPDGTQIVSLDWSARMALWNLETGAVRWHESPGLNGVRFSPDGRYVVGGGVDNAVWEFDTTNWESRRFDGHQSAVSRALYSPDGQSLLSASYDHTVRLWDRASGEVLHVLKSDGAIAGIEFSPDGQTVVTAGGGNVIRLWDRGSGEQLRELPGHTSFIYNVAFSPDGTMLASGSVDGTILLWDMTVDEPVAREFKGHTSSVYGVRFSPDSRYLASAALDRCVRLWDTSAAQRIPRTEGHTDIIASARFSGDGRRIVSCAADTTVRVWDSVTGEQLRLLEGHTEECFDAALNHDGTRIASTGLDHTVRIWDGDQGATLAVLAGHTKRGSSVRFLPGSEQVISSSVDRTVRLWDSVAGTQLASLPVGNKALYLSLTRDGKMAALGVGGQQVHLLDLRRMAMVRTFVGVTAGIWGTAISRDGRLVAAADESQTVRVWDAASGRATLVLPLPGRPYQLAFDPDGQRLGIPLSDGTARIVDLDGNELLVLRGHTAEVACLTFSEDGQRVVTAGDDGTVRLWDAPSGHPVWRAPLLRGADASLSTHLGWIGLAGELDRTPRAWRSAVDERAVQASDADGMMCLRSHDGVVEGWDTEADSRLFAHSLDGAGDVLATPSACVVLAGDQLLWLDRGGDTRILAEGVRAVSLDHDEILIAAEEEIRTCSLDGTGWIKFPGDVGIRAMAHLTDRLVVGYDNGNIEVRDVSGRGGSNVTFENTPSSDVVQMIEGPMGTLIVGFSNGMMGIWQLDSGALLEQRHLHGAVKHLLLKDGRLHAATELGSHQTLDLSVFDQERCELLRSVWQQVPVLWKDGLPVPADPPPDHECFTVE